ncbi:MAG: hypothetical protein AUJ49_08305 [Desulfovibrionaceae bacterium CG1_02_65_16]|nr:MAG: hypothetical protein AUJ49_08305 [Desulfovibrionaceae bacterium CG1_02_65_16]
MDDSEHSNHAFSYALGLAHTQGAHVGLLHCYPRIPMLIGGGARADLVDEYVKQTETLLAPYVEQLRAIGSEPGVLIKEGRPGEVIVDEAENGGYDLIVMGAHGGSDLGEMIMGSTAHRVLSTAHCPVLLAR